MGSLFQSFISSIGCLIVLLLAPLCPAVEQGGLNLYQLDFTHAGQDGKKWLVEQGFELFKAMKRNGDIQLSGSGDGKGLLVSAAKETFGLAVNKTLHLAEVERGEIEWSIKKYPKGASWGDQINREALMVQLFFGSEVDADKIYLPPSPYFSGFFLCKDGPAHTSFTGRSYRHTGRFICLDTPAPGEAVMSKVELQPLYISLFASDGLPPVTGIGLEVDTSGLAGGSAEAYIKRITLYAPVQEK